MERHDDIGDLAIADEETVQQYVAFLLRLAETKRKYEDANLMSEVTAKRILSGLKKSGFVLMKQAPPPVVEYQPRLI